MSTYQPVVIIGAGRSGTNLLRDALSRFPSTATWPCDEINYLWRVGNASYPTDAMPPELATEAIGRRIRRGFDRVATRNQAGWVLEKTCANSLRVSFVDRVVPDAKYVLITRDGYDVTASAMKRWRAPIDPYYLAKKARFVPWSDLPRYAARYLMSHAHRLASGDGRLSTWGPRFDGLDDLCRKATLAEVCATQWSRCVHATREALSEIAPDRQIAISYEELVRQPRRTLDGLRVFLDLPESAEATAALEGSVFTGSLGAGRRALDSAELSAVEPIIESTHATAFAA